MLRHEHLIRLGKAIEERTQEQGSVFPMKNHNGLPLPHRSTPKEHDPTAQVSRTTSVFMLMDSPV